MEGRVPVIIQGRTIKRERQTKRLERTPYSSRSFSKPQSKPESYSLSTLRGSRSLAPSKGELRPRQRRYQEEAVPRNNPLLIKIAISTLIALVILLLNTIQLPFTQALVGHIRTAVNQDFDLDEALGKLKFVGDLLPDEVRSVFGQNPEQDLPDHPVFSSPARGEIVLSFGEQITLPETGKVYVNQGIDIQTETGAPFFASAEGLVAAVEEHEIFGPSVWLDHGNRIFSFYGRCGSIEVKKGDKVQSGERLGMINTTSDNRSILHFQIWVDDKPEDPLEKISGAGQEKEGRGV
ncbi:MAG: peptidoglycan DD-metalloendopeptidase family protein [Caldicoprobacterales bacterium]|jgi:murein DD-endopeptidase MepM/ murein hydrolase activator NlpD|nr:M23 family metallopeptidase [Clostridiales bacterium]